MALINDIGPYIGGARQGPYSLWMLIELVMGLTGLILLIIGTSLQARKKE